MTPAVYRIVSTGLEAEVRRGDGTTETGDQISDAIGSTYDIEGLRFWAEGHREKAETAMAHFGSSEPVIGSYAYTGNQHLLGTTGNFVPRILGGQEIASPQVGQTLFEVDSESGCILVLSRRVANEAIKGAPYSAYAFDAGVGALGRRLSEESIVHVATRPAILSRDYSDAHSIPATDSQAVLIGYLEEKGHLTVASHIHRCLELRSEDPDEAPIVIESLRSLATFIVMTPNLLTPIVSSDPEGLMELEWHLQDNGDPGTFWGRGNGVVSLKFLRSELVQFVTLSGPHQKGVERLRKQGNSTREYLLSSLGEFAPRITRG